ncbi:MAG: ABC transporter substrate-binding protein [Synergistaceae bacterium]|jgi:NitT/TauT family transport system substrate-binding protein|nr:ABC transporter substrate-binding protein [Synergistaceae bacterium]
MKKINMGIVFTVLSVILFAASSYAGTKVRIGADSASFSYPFRVALSTGIFEKHNIDAEIFTFAYGIDTVNAAILGETDTAEAMDFAAASRFSDNNQLRVVCLITISNPGGSNLYTRNPEIKTLKDLEGKKVGVQKATANEYTWGRLFAKHGIDKTKVEQIYLGSNAELLAAYQAKEIDAFWVSADTEAAVLEIPESRSLGNNEISGYLSRGYLLINEDFIKDNKETVVGFIKALDEASAFINEKPDETAVIANKDLKIPLDAAKKNIYAHKYIVRFLQEDVDTISDVANWAVDNGLIRNRYDVKDVLYLDAIKEAFPDRVDVK